MKYLLTIGGLTHPQTRVAVMEALRAFTTLYNEEPTAMTIMPCGLEEFLKMLRSEASGFYENGIETEKRLRDGKSIQVCGMTVTLGPTFTLSS